MFIKLARFQPLARSRALFRYLARLTAAPDDRRPHAGPRTPNAGLFGVLVDTRRRRSD
jgi:hypothetical protein